MEQIPRVSPSVRNTCRRERERERLDVSLFSNYFAALSVTGDVQSGKGAKVRAGPR